MDMLHVVTTKHFKRGKYTMKYIGIVLLFLGIIAMAGSANDCDGKCMEQANTLGEMLLIALFGLTSSVIGGIILFNESQK